MATTGGGIVDGPVRGPSRRVLRRRTGPRRAEPLLPRPVGHVQRAGQRHHLLLRRLLPPQHVQRLLSRLLERLPRPDAGAHRRAPPPSRCVHRNPIHHRRR